jgi:hypothetical protein
MPHTCHEGEDRGMVIALLAVLGVDLILDEGDELVG